MVNKENLLPRTFKYQPDVTSRIDEHGRVFVSRQGDDQIFQIDGIAAVVWSKIPGRSVENIIKQVSYELNLKTEKFEIDVIKFVDQLLSMKLLM